MDINSNRYAGLRVHTLGESCESGGVPLEAGNVIMIVF